MKLELLPRRRPVLAFACLQLGLTLVFFSPALLSGGVLLPAELLHAPYPWRPYFPVHRSHNPELLDALVQYHPWFTHFAESVRAGSWPLWLSDSGGGHPFAANPLTACYFPLTWLALLGPFLGWNLLLASRLALAGLAAFVWLRMLGRSWWASAACAAAFSFSLPFVSWLQWPHGNVNALLPFLLAAAVATARGAPRSAAAFGGVLLLMHLGGQPEATLVNAAAAVLVFAFSRPARPVRRAALLVAGGTLGTLAAAVQLLPFLSYLGKSRAWLLPGHETAALPPSRLVTWLAPLFFGREMDRNAWSSGLGFLDFAGFAGVTLAGLAVVALALGRGRRVAGLGIAGVLTVVLSYGLLPAWVVRELPFVGKAMLHRSLPIAALAVITLAALGWDALRALGRRRTRLPWPVLASPAILAAALVAAMTLLRPGAPAPLLAATALPELLRAPVLLALPLAIALFPRGSAGLRGALLVAFVMADLWHATFDYLGAAPKQMVFPGTHLTDRLRAERPVRVLPLGFVAPPNLLLPYGIQSVLTYDGLGLRDQELFLTRLGGYQAAITYSTVFAKDLKNPRVLELLSVDYILDSPEGPRLDTEAYRRATGFDLRLDYDAPDGRAYRLLTARPRVWFAGRATADPGLVHFTKLLEARSEQASRELYLDARPLPGRQDGGTGEARLERYEHGTVVASVRARGPGHAVFAETYEEGWTATVNGAPAAVHRANGILRAVPVPPGESTVVLTYRPASFRLGGWISLAGLLGLLALARRPRAMPRQLP